MTSLVSEIDTFKGVNLQPRNQLGVHTFPECTSVAPVQAQTSVAPVQASTSVAPVQTQTSVAPAKPQTSLASVQPKTSVGPVQAQVSMAPVQVQASVAPVQASMAPAQAQTSISPVQPQTSVTPPVQPQAPEKPGADCSTLGEDSGKSQCVLDEISASFGEAFARAGGGVFVTEFAQEGTS